MALLLAYIYIYIYIYLTVFFGNIFALDFPGGSEIKNLSARCSIPGLGIHPLVKKMSSRSCILAWKIPWTGEPGRLRSMGLQELDPT